MQLFLISWQLFPMKESDLESRPARSGFGEMVAESHSRPDCLRPDDRTIRRIGALAPPRDTLDRRPGRPLSPLRGRFLAVHGTRTEARTPRPDGCAGVSWARRHGAPGGANELASGAKARDRPVDRRSRRDMHVHGAGTGRVAEATGVTLEWEIRRVGRHARDIGEVAP